MIALTSNRISEDRRDGPGRYVLWLSGGEVRCSWESETKVKGLFDTVGLTLVDKGEWKQPDTRFMSAFHVPLPFSVPMGILALAIIAAMGFFWLHKSMS